MRYDEEEENDYFDGPDLPEVEEKPKPKKPALSPDDPLYWEQDEDEFEHLKPKRSRRIWIWLAALGVGLGVLIALYIRTFVPYVDTATQYGYVEGIEKRGTVFKTYEGVILPYKSLMDTLRPYEGDFEFSTTDTDLAVKLRRSQYANRPVRVDYQVYRTAMPWRGDCKIVVKAVEPVAPRDILPPDRLPEVHKN